MPGDSESDTKIKQDSTSASASSSGGEKLPYISSYHVDPRRPDSKYQGTHSFNVKGEKFVVDTKYSPLKPVGSGAYGMVCSALDKVRNKKVAIKKITGAFDDLVDAKRIVREVKLLRHFTHENIVRVRDLIPPLDIEEFYDIYMVMDLMETDLHKIIYSKNALSDDHIQYFIYQVLRGLKYIHSANVLHRDLKPSNLLVNGNCDLKICDFGLARGVDQDADYDLTEYVVTRWYRAPELLTACLDYDDKIDLWAVGCIMAELHGRKPLFAGEDYLSQMKLIFSVLGTPSEEDMKFLTNDKAKEYIRSLKVKPPVPLDKLYPDANPLAIDCMQKLLAFDPNKRMSAAEALTHPYFKKLHNPKSALRCETPFNFEFEKIDTWSREVLQEMMWDEVKCYRTYLRNAPLPPVVQPKPSKRRSTKERE
jgi:serine/threonine protein kinase